MARSLPDFLSHGLLPFVGRGQEAERIIQFWSATLDSNQFRVALLSGEAGIGKSRLVEELIPRIARLGGAVVHTKLYPESTTSIAPLIARALRMHRFRGGVLEEGGGALAAVTADLRTLTRLRPTILIIEDIHLLSAGTLTEFRSLVDALAGEMLAMVCVTRPIELTARSLLEPFLADEISVPNLGEEDVAAMLFELFALTETPEVARLLHETTLGNPLALRSAIRGALGSGAFVVDAATDRWRVALPLPVLAQTLRQNVTLLSEGMVMHLNEEERRVAAMLACLGEVFSHEAAVVLLESDCGRIDDLIAKGIIGRSSTPAESMSGTRSSDTLFAFTHTILHNYLLQRASCRPESLVRVIGEGIPLYSIIPFQQLAGSERKLALGPVPVEHAVMHALDIAVALDASPDWRLGIEAWSAAVAMVERTDGWSELQQRRLRAELLSCRLNIQSRSEDHDEVAQLVEEFLSLTEEPLNPSLRIYRLRAFSALHALGRRLDSQMCNETWRRAKAFVALYPELRRTITYVRYLESAARSMLYMGNDETLKLIEQELLRLAEDNDVNAEYRNQVRQIIAFHFLELFETPDELEQRLAILDEVEPLVEPRRRMSFLISKTVFMYLIGRMDEAITLADYGLPRFQELSLTNNYFYGALGRACAFAALGAGINDLEEELGRLIAAVPPDIPNFALFAEMALVEMALHQGAGDWIRARMERYYDAMQNLRPEAQLILMEEFGMLPNGLVEGARAVTRAFQPIVAMLASADAPSDAVLTQQLRKALEAPVLRLSDLHEKQALVAVARSMALKRGAPGILDELGPVIATSIEHALEWIATLKLPAIARPLIEAGTPFLDARAVARWRARMAELARERHAQAPGFAQAARERQGVSMLGAVQFHPLRGEPIPIRGSRLRMLLGLMVADRIRSEPLPYRDFSAIVAGTDDPDKARKTLNGVVFRLRELMGHDAILTDNETPELNLAQIDVDLLAARAELNEASAALREHSLLRAQRRILGALAITQGQVPFPALYEDFFEQVRGEFENELRGLLLRVARELLAGGDAVNAEALLRISFASMPGDEELAELLCDALQMGGKRTEAERVRMRMSERNE